MPAKCRIVQLARHQEYFGSRLAGFRFLRKQHPYLFSRVTNMSIPPHGPRKPVVIHYHIFKNAGTSVDASLEASFGPKWTGFEGAHAADIQSAAALGHFLEAHPDIEAVSTHLGRPPLPWANCLPIVFLRHPILRAQSVYEFTRRDPTQPFSEAAQAQGFADYVRWALAGNGNGIVIRNYQVVHLSAASFRAPHIYQARATRDDLRACCDLLAAWGIAGVVENFGASAKAYQSAYAAKAPALSFAPLWLNRTQLQNGSVKEQLAAIRASLGAGLYDELLDQNELDLELHRFACGMQGESKQGLLF